MGDGEDVRSFGFAPGAPAAAGSATALPARSGLNPGRFHAGSRRHFPEIGLESPNLSGLARPSVGRLRRWEVRSLVTFLSGLLRAAQDGAVSEPRRAFGAKIPSFWPPARGLRCGELVSGGTHNAFPEV